MAKFQYHARSAKGQSVNGVLEAVSAESAAGILSSRGLIPLKVEPESGREELIKKINALLGSNNVTDLERVIFCRQMYTICKSGIPLTRGLRGLSQSIQHDYFSWVVSDLADRIETGIALSQAMRTHGNVFNGLFISMVAVGENSGRLDEAFRQIGFYIERDENSRKKIKEATRYPTFVLIALALAVVAMNIWVVPAFATMFQKFNSDLPIVTKLIIGTSNLFVHYWHLMLALVLGIFFAWRYYLRTPDGAYFWGQKKLRIPIVGSLIEKASMARYARSFSLMLGAGVPITQALSLCAQAIDNPFLSKKINAIKEGITRGEGLLRTHSHANIFTPLVLQMVAVGEESGQVENLLEEVADFYEREVDYELKTLTDRIEPILIVVMAIFVGVLGLGIFLPIWDMYGVQSR